MLTTEKRPLVAPGEAAPDFTLAAVHREGTVSLSDFRGRPVFLALLLGLWCPFCRRQIAQLGDIAHRLDAEGVQSLGVVATAAENARLYVRFRPTRLPLAADPELSTHEAYGVPKPVVTPEFLQALETTRINPFGDLPEPLPVREAAAAITQRDGYLETETDRADVQRQWPQLKAQFLIDAGGIVRWTNLECGTDGPAGLGKLPSVDEILATARTLQ